MGSAFLGLSLLLPGSSAAATVIDWLTIDGGGAMGTGGPGVALSGTVGQPDAGTVSGGRWTLSGGFWRGGAAVSAVPGEPGAGGAPLAVFRLAPPAPNPVAATTRLRFELPAAGRTTLRIFDVRGRRVRTLVEEALPAGAFSPQWDGADDRGAPVAAGTYFLRLEAGPRRATQKLVVAR
jgi:hypothetical protein